MIAAASPRFMESDTLESTVSGPRGVGYCLLTSVISSMDGRGGDVPVHFDGARGHLRDTVVLTNALPPAAPQIRQPLAVFPQLVYPLRQAARAVRLDQHSATGTRENLGKRAAPRLNGWHAIGHCLQHRQTFRLIVGAGYAHHVQIA